MAAATLVTVAVVGLMVKIYLPAGLTRQIRIEGLAPPYPPTQETARAEVWFPDQRILFDTMGRQWYRDECGRQTQRSDPHSSYRTQIGPYGNVLIAITLTSWAPPRRCTVRFYTEGVVTRYARNAPCVGWGQKLVVQLPTLPAATLLDEELRQ